MSVGRTHVLYNLSPVIPSPTTICGISVTRVVNSHSASHAVSNNDIKSAAMTFLTLYLSSESTAVYCEIFTQARPNNQGRRHALKSLKLKYGKQRVVRVEVTTFYIIWIRCWMTTSRHGLSDFPVRRVWSFQERVYRTCQASVLRRCSCSAGRRCWR